MNEFKINRNSWHYKFNKNFMNENGFSDYLMQKHWEPKVNNFCAYWRATIFRIIFALMIAIVAFGFLFAVVSIVAAYPMEAVQVFGLVFGIIVACVGLLFMFLAVTKSANKVSNSNSLIVMKVKAYKSKICPSVTYNDGEKEG